MVCVTCPRRWGARTGGTGWLCRRRRWRWAQRTGRGPGGWPAYTQPRLSPGVLVQDSHRSSFCSNNLTEHTPQRGAACGSYVAQSALFRHITARGGAGPNRPPACGALWKVAQLGKRARATPRQAAGGLRQGSQASVWGPAARKGAVWAEGLAEGAPRARPGHHRAASCGLRRCRELRIMDMVAEWDKEKEDKNQYY